MNGRQDLPSEKYKGNLDGIRGNCLVGWVYNTMDKGQPVKVQLFDGDKPISNAIASEYREDIELLFPGSGPCGFAIPITVNLLDGDLHCLSVRVAEEGFVIPNSSYTVGPTAFNKVLERLTSLGREVAELRRSLADAFDPAPKQSYIDQELSFQGALDPASEAISPLVKALRQRIVEEYRDNVVDGVLAEIIKVHLAHESLASRLRSLEAKMTFRDILLPDLQADALPDIATSIEIDAEFPLRSQQGFYPLEYDGNGHPFRWTGPEPTFFFDVLLSRKIPYHLDLRIIHNQAKRLSPLLIRGFVDDKEISLRTSQESASITRISGTITKDSNFGYTRIAFLTPKLFQPSMDDENSSDERALGVAFLKLTVRPLTPPSRERGDYSLN